MEKREKIIQIKNTKTQDLFGKEGKEVGIEAFLRYSEQDSERQKLLKPFSSSGYSDYEYLRRKFQNAGRNAMQDKSFLKKQYLWIITQIILKLNYIIRYLFENILCGSQRRKML